MTPRFINAVAWARKGMLRVGQLVTSNADLSHIAGVEDWRYTSLTAQTGSGSVTFTLPQPAMHVEELRWNNLPVLMGNQFPGFTLAADRVTITTNFTPIEGDLLVAKILL